MHEHHNHFFHQSCQTPVGWLRAISDGAHLIHLDWNQIGWKTKIVQMMFHVKQLIKDSLFCRADFTIPLRPCFT